VCPVGYVVLSTTEDNRSVPASPPENTLALYKMGIIILAITTGAATSLLSDRSSSLLACGAASGLTASSLMLAALA
jgi:hypothetical protein